MLHNQATRRGFTLVELLVVIAIIGILMSMILPAVQSARESGRRTQCGNNLKQIATAMLSYESSKKMLPFGSGYNVNVKLSNWVRSILPMLEQNSLYNSFDFNVAMSHANNTAAVTTVIPDFICPSDPQSSEPILSGRKEGGGSNPTACLGLWYPVSIGPTAPDFCAFGLDTTPSSTNPTCKHCNFGTENGGFCKGSGLKGTKCYSGLFGRSIYGLRLSLVRDGLSKTLMNGETLPSHSSYNGAFCHNFPVASTQIPLNLMETDTGYSRVSGFKSAHPTGAQFSFGDGSVTMLSSEIDYVLWNRLGDREDGKSVSIP